MRAGPKDVFFEDLSLVTIGVPKVQFNILVSVSIRIKVCTFRQTEIDVVLQRQCSHKRHRPRSGPTTQPRLYIPLVPPRTSKSSKPSETY
jgi:hypothetical protein